MTESKAERFRRDRKLTTDLVRNTMPAEAAFLAESWDEGNLGLVLRRVAMIRQSLDAIEHQVLADIKAAAARGDLTITID